MGDERPAPPPTVIDSDTIDSDTVDDETAMGLALEQAGMAAAGGDVPVGAVALRDGRVIAAAHNRREVLGDPTAHAEILLLAETARRLGRWRLDDVTVVVTLEPCVMCAGALLAARVERVVFGAEDPKAGALGSLYNVAADPRLNHEFGVRPRVRAEECGELLSNFFVDRR
jgi:tRNA(adenine34) deaminase